MSLDISPLFEEPEDGSDSIASIVANIIETAVVIFENEPDECFDMPSVKVKSEDVKDEQHQTKQDEQADKNNFLINFSAAHKAELLKLLSKVFTKLPCSNTFRQLEDVIPEYYCELSYLVNYFNTSLGVKKIWTDIHLMKPPTSHWDLRSEGSTTLMHCYLKYWLLQFYNCNSYISKY